MNLGKLGVWYLLDLTTSQTAIQWVKRIESLGYSALWIPETMGRDPIADSAFLLAHSKKLIIATGIANIYNRVPGSIMQAQQTLAEQSDNRFLLGLGVSHAPIVEKVRGLTYARPLTKMTEYLDAMDHAPYTGIKPASPPHRVIAALGPKMLQLAKEKCMGAHPYFTSPQHTKMARSILGEEKWLCVEQKIILTTDKDLAYKQARRNAQIYIKLPNYRANWKRMGLNENDLDTMSDKFIEATLAWGDVNRICKRIQEHFEAGASHVCIQPLNPNGVFGDLDLDALEQIANVYFA